MLSPEDDSSLVLLDHLDHEEEGDGEGDHDEEQRSDGHDERADSGSLLANWKKGLFGILKNLKFNFKRTCSVFFQTIVLVFSSKIAA